MGILESVAELRLLDFVAEQTGPEVIVGPDEYGVVISVMPMMLPPEAPAERRPRKSLAFFVVKDEEEFDAVCADKSLERVEELHSEGFYNTKMDEAVCPCWFLHDLYKQPPRFAHKLQAQELQRPSDLKLKNHRDCPEFLYVDPETDGPYSRRVTLGEIEESDEEEEEEEEEESVPCKMPILA